MASSTTPHCSITPTKPYQTPHHHHPNLLNHHRHSHGHRRRHHPHQQGPNHWSSHISLNASSPTPPTPTTHRHSSSADANPVSSSSAAANPNSRRNPRPTSLGALRPSPRSELGLDFCGRRSTRFVSKMHLGRPRSASAFAPSGSGSSRHSPIADEVLHLVSQLAPGDLKGLDSVLLGYESHLRGSTDDYTFLLRELGNLGECAKAVACFEFALRREWRRNEQGKLSSSMISTLGRLGEVDLAIRVFEVALEGGYGNSVYAFSALISANGRNGRCNEAIRVFESMKTRGLKPNLVTYNAVIDACAKGGVLFERAAEVFDEMLNNGVQPDRITFNSLLAVCSRGGLWEEARELFNEMVCRGIEQDMFTYNTLLDAICKGGQMDLAIEIVSDMSLKNIFPNVVTYSTLVDGYAKAGRLDEALSLFDEMKLAGTGLDRVSYNTLLSIYARLGRFDEALNICKEMERCGVEKDAVTYNALLGGYGKQGKYEEVRRVFAEMKAERFCPNLLTYSTLIDVYSKGGLYNEAMEAFREFKQVGLKADVVLYSALIDALCKNGLVESAVSVLDQMTREGIRPNVVTYNSIIDAFGRPVSPEYTHEACDGASESLSESSSSVMEDAVESEIGDWEDNRIIEIFGQLAAEKSSHHAKKEERSGHEIVCILDVFRQMKELEIRPNVVTFSAILNACSRCNSFQDASMLLEELRLFDNKVYGVAHGLLMGHKENIWVQAQYLFDEVKQMDSSTASAFYNALTDMLWHFSQKRGAQMVVLDGKHRQVWENMWTDSCLDLHLMSSGAARAMVHAWLLNIRTIVFGGRELPKLLSILTGWGKHSKVVGGGALRRAIGALLVGMGAPFRVARCNLGRFISTGDVMTAWLKDTSTLRVLVLHDDRTHPGIASTSHIPNFLAVPL